MKKKHLLSFCRIGHTKMLKPMIEAFKSYKANQSSEYDVDKFTNEYMDNHINTEEKMNSDIPGIRHDEPYRPYAYS